MKPDWKDAPEWAKYLAMDANRLWWWHENKPLQGNTCWICTTGDTELAGGGFEWKDSLEQRPETSGTTSGGTP